MVRYSAAAFLAAICMISSNSSLGNVGECHFESALNAMLLNACSAAGLIQNQFVPATYTNLPPFSLRQVLFVQLK